MQKRTLRGITPFNDCWFRTCYYHQLMAGMSYFGVPQAYTVLNYTEEISCGSGLGECKCVGKDLLNAEEYAQLIGVTGEKGSPKDIIAAAIKSIDRNRPLIIGQDNYFLTYRPEYHIRHELHFVLAFGYDRSEQTFTVMEHSFASGLDFHPRQVPFKTVSEAYEGFCGNFTKFSWQAEELHKNGNAASLMRKRKILDKLCEPLYTTRLDEYVRFYEMSINASIEDLPKANEFCISLTHHMRIMLLRYEMYCGTGEITELLTNVWQCMHYFQGAVTKACFKKSPEVLRMPQVEKRLNDMKENVEKFSEAVKKL